MHVTRRLIQAGFLALTLVGVFVVRGNAEAWCPFGGIETAYAYFREGNLICSLAVSNLYALAGILLLALLFRRAFCGYLCPIGTISEWLQRAAHRLGLRAARVPYALDRSLALLKNVVLAVILFFTWRAGELVFRGYDPCYALLSRHGEDILIWAYVVTGVIVLASLAVVMPFCRWFCPLAAVLAPFSRAGVARIKRVPAACTTCGSCERRCPMGIRVAHVEEVTASRCISCFECVNACPPKLSALSWGPPRWLGGRWPKSVVPIAVVLCVSIVAVAAYALPLPSFTRTWAHRPATPATIDLVIDDLTCRGRASLLVYFLERDDELALPGLVALDAWPAPRDARVRVTYDEANTTPLQVKQALTEPYFDRDAGIWRSSPFRIHGYDPLDALLP